MLTFERIAKAIEIVLLMFGAYLAYQALGEYRSQAKIAVLNRLDEGDAKLSEMQITRPYVASIYSDLRSSLPPREQADIYLAMMAGCGYPANNPCSLKDGLLPQWKTIPELECAIWDGSDFNSKTKQRLRDGFAHAEAILYLVARAHERKVDKSRLFSQIVLVAHVVSHL